MQSLKLWTISLSCLLMNSTWEFLKWEEKVCLQSLLTLSTTCCLESNSNTTLLSCKSLTYFIAWKSPNDSPILTSTIGEIYWVFASTNWPIILYIHTPIPTLLRDPEKEASTLPLYRRIGGLVQTALYWLVLVIAIVTHILFMSPPG